MSAIKKEIVLVDVTRGDCLEPNRKSGRSNTGTYFVSSLKDFDTYKDFIGEDKEYRLNLNKVREYSILFENLPTDFLDAYNGKGAKFKSFSNYLLSLDENPKIMLSLRINDSRVFMRFLNNTDPIINAFRNLLYEDISKICIEKNDNQFAIYPYLNAKQLNRKKEIVSDGFELDE